MPYTPFNPNSPRAKAGLKFQQDVFDKLQEMFPEVEFEMTWDFYKKQDPSLTNKELAIIEKKQGDITYIYNGERRYIECCFAMSESYSRLCEMKRRSFIGPNKWYCYGFKNSTDIVFIPSAVWKKYTSHIEKADKSCRMVPIDSIKNLRCNRIGITEYWGNAHR